MALDPVSEWFDDAVNQLKGIVFPVKPRLLSNISSVYPDTEAMSELLMADPALCLSVLKANSFQKSPELSQTSIQEAIDELGGERLMIMIKAVMFIMAKHGDFHQWDFEDFWDTSKQVADITTELARQLNIPLVDEAQCVGILHNAGMPFLWQKHPNYFDQIKELDGKSLIAREDELFKCDHATIGFYIAKGLNLDHSVCEVIRLHHFSEDILCKPQVTDDKTQTLLALLKIAENIAEEQFQLVHSSDQTEWDRMKGCVFEILGISELDYEDLAGMFQN